MMQTLAYLCVHKDGRVKAFTEEPASPMWESEALVLRHEAQAEIDALHAECDRLTALLGKPKVLDARELTEPGWYWHKWPLQKEWKIVKVHHPEQAAAQFVGPLLAPEV